MNTSNSQEHYNEFFDTFFSHDWSIYSQKIYELDSKEVLGSELLLRVGDDGNFLDNSLFFPGICEDSRYLDVSSEMLNLVKNRFTHNPESFFEKTFINISPNEMRNKSVFLLLKELGNLFKESNKRIVIELSEIFTAEDFVDLRETLDKLCSNHIELAIDDYGKGLLDRQSLKNINLSYLKIDKSISDQIKINNDLVNDIIEYCKENGILSIAEGIESRKIENLLHSHGVRLGQGFYFHKPEFFVKF